MVASTGVVVVRRVAARAWSLSPALTRSAVVSAAVVTGRVVRTMTALTAPPPRRIGVGALAPAVPEGAMIVARSVGASAPLVAVASGAVSVAARLGVGPAAVAVLEPGWVIRRIVAAGAEAVA